MIDFVRFVVVVVVCVCCCTKLFALCSEWFRIRRLTDPLWQFIEARKEQQQQWQ